MIASNELRIGNSVAVDGKIQEVVAITGKTVLTAASRENDMATEEHQLNKIEPIPITDQLLSEWGFVYHDYFKFWQRISSGVTSDLDIDRDYDLIDFMRRPIVKKLKSLHQLQNIYFVLRGKELERKPGHNIPGKIVVTI